ncbi:signal peptide peptidase-domain-containing protein [Lineolata rhizophorae]|uniref:Signal peptide peptidase-domain-containing protein n=1 Tax=Lineolata rhizophorae TaxID=578093 RepID=A0A6A6NSD2_9PEZI|nr:signal peptide peptidase-domain-containing protein [Lineolata rhizophorae]
MAPGVAAEALGWIAYEFARIQPQLPTHLHLVLSALLPIYTGAFASLCRPASAAEPEARGRRVKRDSDNSDDDDDGVVDDDADEQMQKRMEGLSLSDAVMFPVFAGSTLAGLYFLIQWLKDPAILNAILNYYLAVVGVFSVSKFVADTFSFVHELLFPAYYVHDGILFHVNRAERKIEPYSGPVQGSAKRRHSPLPGFLSRVPLPSSVSRLLWSWAIFPEHKLIVRIFLRRVLSVKVRFDCFLVIGALTALTSEFYFTFIDRPWWLTNLLGFSFAYGTMQMLSPTTFGIGSVILCALFFYDIYFVFFTPMMVTVAKSLDIPIKLLFPQPSTGKIASHAMLGLGDVVLPGIMIGLALRFDLFLHYLRRQRRADAPSTLAARPHGLENSSEGSIAIERAKYRPVSGTWGSYFWTRTWLGHLLISEPYPCPDELRVHFPTPYFNAALTGYVVGLIVTLAAMHVSNHPQPALLYLVPGVLLFLYATATLKGELREFWNYTELVEEEIQGSIQMHDPNAGRSKKHAKESHQETGGSSSQKPLVSDAHEALASGSRTGSSSIQRGHSGHPQESKAKPRKKSTREIFAFRVFVRLARQRSTSAEAVNKENGNTQAAGPAEMPKLTENCYVQNQTSELHGKEPRWKSPQKDGVDTEPAGKRQRIE